MKKMILCLSIVLMTLFLAGCRTKEEIAAIFYQEDVFSSCSNYQYVNDQEIYESSGLDSVYGFGLYNKQGVQYDFYVDHMNGKTTALFQDKIVELTDVKKVYQESIFFSDDRIIVIDNAYVYIYDLDFNYVNQVFIDYLYGEKIVYQGLARLHNGIYGISITNDYGLKSTIYLSKVFSLDYEINNDQSDDKSTVIDLEYFPRIKNYNQQRSTNFDDMSYFIIDGILFKYDSEITLIGHNYLNVYAYDENGPSEYLMINKEERQIKSYGNDKVNIDFNDISLYYSFFTNDASYFIFSRLVRLGLSMWDGSTAYQLYVMKINDDFDVSYQIINGVDLENARLNMDHIELYGKYDDATPGNFDYIKVIVDIS